MLQQGLHLKEPFPEKFNESLPQNNYCPSVPSPSLSYAEKRKVHPLPPCKSVLKHTSLCGVIKGIEDKNLRLETTPPARQDESMETFGPLPKMWMWT